MVEKRYQKADITYALKDLTDADRDLERERHAAIKKVTQSLEEGFKFNTTISHMMVLANAIDKHKGGTSHVMVVDKAIETLVLLLAPIAPHVCEEMGQMMTPSDAGLAGAEWPVFDESAMSRSTVTMAVQVNGKVRGQFEIPVGASQDEMKAVVLADPNVKKYVQDLPIKKFIVVPNKLISIVV